jgi:hypothetical protein
MADRDDVGLSLARGGLNVYGQTIAVKSVSIPYRAISRELIPFA